MAAKASAAKLTGLPRRLVQDGIIEETVVEEAVKEARKKKLGLV